MALIKVSKSIVLSLIKANIFDGSIIPYSRDLKREKVITGRNLPEVLSKYERTSLIYMTFLEIQRVLLW
jgi:hypothetical protein